MATNSTRTRLYAKLKTIPDLYRSLRFLWRRAKACWLELWRFVGAGVRIGGPRGCYSGLERLRGGICEGAIVLEGQALPPLPKASLIQRASMDQNGRQSWPIFWLRLPQDRLAGESLAPLDHRKHLTWVVGHRLGETKSRATDRPFCRRGGDRRRARGGRPSPPRKKN